MDAAATVGSQVIPTPTVDMESQLPVMTMGSVPTKRNFMLIT